MRKIIVGFFFMLCFNAVNGQSCEDLIKYVKTQGYGTTYTSFNSDAISKVTFYQIQVEYQTQYFAIVCFKKKNSYSCSEYIYQVGSNTKFNYSLNYLNSAGQAFWKFIQPYSDNLGCAPDFN